MTTNIYLLPKYDNNKQQSTSSIKSSFEKNPIVSSTTDLHSTKWSDISLIKFTSLVSVASTFENTIFYPCVFSCCSHSYFSKFSNVDFM